MAEGGHRHSAVQSYMPLGVQRRNLIFVILDGMAIGLMSAAGTFISILVIRLGASPLWVSLLSSLPSAISLVMAIPWAGFAERQSRPQATWAWSRLLVHLAYPLIATVPFLLQGEMAAMAVVIVWSLSAFPSSLSNIMFTVVTGNAAPPERRAFLMSRRWTFMGLAKLISVPLAGLLIERLALPTGYQVVFFANFAVALLAFYSAMQIQTIERHRAAPRITGPLRTRMQQGLAQVTQERAFLAYVAGRATLNLGMALVSAIIPIFWVREIGASDAWVGYFATALSAATLVSYAPWVRIKRMMGTRWTLIASVLGTALYPGLLALARSPVAVLPFIALEGLAAGGLNLAFFDSLLDICPQDKQERFIAINMTAVNLMGVIGPPIGAALLEVVGIRWVMRVATVIALVGAAVFALVTGPRRGTPPRSTSLAPESALAEGRAEKPGT